MNLSARGSAILWLLLFGLFAATSSAFAQKSTVFFVQLGAFKTVPEQKLTQLKDIAPIYSEKTGKNLQRLLLGQFTTRPDAEKALQQVKIKGFADAFIVERNSDKVPTIYDALDSNTPPAAVTPTPSRKNDQSKAYMVQVGAFAGKVPMNDILALVNLGNIYTETSDNLTKVYIGGFSSRGASSDAFSGVKAAGFPKAFVKEVSMASVTLLIEQKQGIPQPSTPTVVPYASVNFINPIGEFSLETPTDSVEVSGSIFPVTEGVLLFQGFIRMKGDMYGQTLLLRSENGGKNWTEVFKGEYGYDIIYLEYANDQTVYLVTFGIVEGPGGLTLYRSDDGGKSWGEVGEIPKNEHYCTPSYIRMSDTRNGTAVYDCYDDALKLWSTTDGGKNWLYKGIMNKKAFDALPPYQGNSENGIYATINGSNFYKEVATDGALVVYKLNSAANAWEESFRISLYYQLKDGKVRAF